MVPPGALYSLPPFDTVSPADKAVMNAAGIRVDFGADEVHQLDEDHVAVLWSGKAILHRFADVERLVEGKLVLDITHPGAGRPARFHTLDAGTLLWVPRSTVQAVTDSTARLQTVYEQTHDERSDLADLADRQTWVGPPSSAHLSDDPYVGELDHVVVVLPGAQSELVPVLPSGCTPLFGDGRVLLVAGWHGPSSLFSGHNPPAPGGHAEVLVPVQWNGVKGLYCATVWTGQLMYVHVVRELYGLLARSGQVFDPDILATPQRIVAWDRRLRLRLSYGGATLGSAANWEAATGVPWDPTRLPVLWRFRRHSFGVGPRFDRGCDGHYQIGLISFEDLLAPSVESMDGVTLATPAAPIAAFRIVADFRLADPSPLDSPLLARAAAWLIG